MLKTSVFVKSKKDLKQFKAHVDVGFLKTLDEKVLMKAAKNEFGSGRIPERSFMRSTFDENKDKIRAFIRRMAPAVLIGAIPEDDFMMKIGRFLKELIEYKILTAIEWATPLHVVTMANKGHRRPLVDTYEMINSIEIRVGYGDHGNS